MNDLSFPPDTDADTTDDFNFRASVCNQRCLSAIHFYKLLIFGCLSIHVKWQHVTLCSSVRLEADEVAQLQFQCHQL